VQVNTQLFRSCRAAKHTSCNRSSVKLIGILKDDTGLDRFGFTPCFSIHSNTRVTRRLDSPVSTSIAGHSRVKLSTRVSLV
jgi:hypothetical protein